MSQKANLITIRKKNRVELTVHNTKIWVSLYILVENIGRLFFLKGVWVLKSFCSFDTNLVFLNLFLFYQTFKLSAYKRKIIKKPTNSNIYLKNKSISTLFQHYINIFGYNFFYFNVFNLNILVDKKKLSILYRELKIFSFNIFSRRFNLFIDFLKITVLFFDNHISLSSYIKIWARIFKNLHKRIHGKFFLFVKASINSVLKLKLLKKQNDFKSSLSGVKFLLSGRIRGKSRASSTLIQLGSVPTQTINKNIDFASSHVYTLYGVFGIKVWTYFKNK
jgi:hypothetical protein